MERACGGVRRGGHLIFQTEVPRAEQGSHSQGPPGPLLPCSSAPAGGVLRQTAQPCWPLGVSSAAHRAELPRPSRGSVQWTVRVISPVPLLNPPEPESPPAGHVTGPTDLFGRSSSWSSGGGLSALPCPRGLSLPGLPGQSLRSWAPACPGRAGQVGERDTHVTKRRWAGWEMGCACVCVCVCVHARACVRVRARACVCEMGPLTHALY